MKKPFLMIISVIILILTIVFTVQNAASVPINYFFWNGMASLSLLLFITFAVGILTAMIVLVPIIAHLSKVKREKDK